MYSVSQDYLDALDLPVRTYKLAGTIGGVSFDESNVLSIEISNQVSEGSEIKLGSVYIGELTASFYGVTGIARGSWVGKTIVLSEGLMLADNSFEYVPLGVFTIAEANHTQEGVDVVAYDAMTAFDKARNDLTETGTAYDFLSLMCQKCGVTLGMTSADVAALTNGTETLSVYSENDIETWRDLLSWVAQTLCSVATINRAGELELRQYSISSAATIDETHRFTGCSFSDFTTYYTGMSVVNIALRQTEYKSVTPDDGLTYNLGSNPLVQGDYELVQNIIDEFSDVQLVPFSAQMLGGAIYDLCDCLTFSGGIAAGAVCGVMGYTWKYNGAYAVNGFGSNPALATAKSKAQKDIDAIYNTIGEEINQMSVVQNSSSVTCGESTETSILTYNFEVTQEENTTMVDVSVVIDSHARESLVNDVYTLSDVVANLSFYVDDSEVGVYSPRFIVDEGNDTITFNYSLSGLSVGAHEFDVRLTMNGAYGIVGAGNAHELLWGYGITFEVYVKSIEVTTLPTTTTFYAGQRLNYNGIVVSGVYNNGLRTDVTSQSTFDPVAGTVLTADDVGTLTVDVDYDSFSTEFDVDVELLGFDFLVSDDVIPDRNTSQQRMMLFEEDGQLYTAIPDVSSASPFVRYTKLSVASDGTVSVTEANTLTINFNSARTKYYMVKDGTKFYAMAFGGYDSEFGCIDIKNGTVQTYTMTFEYVPDPDITVYTFVPDASGTSVYAWLTSGYVCIDNVRGYLLDNGSYVSYNSMAWGEISGTNIHFRVLDKDQYDYSYYHVGIYARFPLERWVIGTEREMFSKYEDGHINIYQLACGTSGLYTNLIASFEAESAYSNNKGYEIYGAGKVIFPYWITGTYSTIKYIVYDVETRTFFTGEINERDNVDLFYALNNAGYNSMGFDESKGMFFFHYSYGDRTTQYVYATADFTTWIEVTIPSEYFDTYLETYSSQHNNIVAFGGHLIDFGMDSSNVIHPAALIYKVD